MRLLVVSYKSRQSQRNKELYCWVCRRSISRREEEHVQWLVNKIREERIWSKSLSSKKEEPIEEDITQNWRFLPRRLYWRMLFGGGGGYLYKPGGHTLSLCTICLLIKSLCTELRKENNQLLIIVAERRTSKKFKLNWLNGGSFSRLPGSSFLKRNKCGREASIWNLWSPAPFFLN
jgi:hypothetical protein